MLIGCLSALFGFIVAVIFFCRASRSKLKHGLDRLDFALKSGRMGTWDIDIKTDTVSCSQEMLDLWGVGQEEFINDRSILQAKVHPADIDHMRQAIKMAIESDTIYELEYRIRPTPDTERWVLSRGRCTFDNDSKKAVRFSGVVFDITEKKIREAELVAAIKARDRFFMMASHELKTPLTLLQLQLQVNKYDLKNNLPKLESGLEKEQQHLLRITRIVDHILDESRISEGRFSIHREYFDLSAMVAEAVDRFQVIAKSSDVEVKILPSPSIMGEWDKFRLEQVLLNLLINAVRYGNKKPIIVQVIHDSDHVRMIVRDEGRGIKLEDQVRIFDRFERVMSDEHDDARGMGLGLFISNKIVLLHGGEILVKSQIGKGSEFTVVLPANK